MPKNREYQGRSTSSLSIVDLRSAVLSPGIETEDSYELSPQPGQKTPVGGRIKVEMS